MWKFSTKQNLKVFLRHLRVSEDFIMSTPEHTNNIGKRLCRVPGNIGRALGIQRDTMRKGYLISKMPYFVDERV